MLSVSRVDRTPRTEKSSNGEISWRTSERCARGKCERACKARREDVGLSVEEIDKDSSRGSDKGWIMVTAPRKLRAEI
jgi:hypothetical protein